MDAAALIDERIASLGDWRGETLARARGVIRAAVPDVVEEWKWRVPVWSKDGILCTGEAYKAALKLTFPKGAALRGCSTPALTGRCAARSISCRAMCWTRPRSPL